MTDQPWKTWTPQYDGHAPDDWDGGAVRFRANEKDDWYYSDTSHWGWVFQYRYHAKQPDLLAQCLLLPQDQRDALIAELQKPVRDWADDVAEVWWKDENCVPGAEGLAAVIRSKCLSKEDPVLTEIFNFLGGVDGAAELRGRLLKAMGSQS